MKAKIFVLLGSQWLDVPLLRAAAEEFGWTVRTVRDVDELRDERDEEEIGGLFFQHDCLGRDRGWLDTIARLREIAPEARLVACTHFSDADDYPKLCRAGLFHSLWLPLKRNEVLQCMGFLWASEKRAARVHLVARDSRRATG